MCRAVSLGAGTPPSAPVFVTLSGFFAYFEHRRRTPNLAAAAVRPPWPLFLGRRRRYLRSRRRRPSTPFVFVQAPARRQRRCHLPRPLHLLRQPRATLAARRLAPQPSSSPSLLASPTSSTWHTARPGPSLRMPGAGNTAACLRPRRVPGPGKPGAALRQLRLRPTMHARCWQHRRVLSSTMCPRG